MPESTVYFVRHGETDYNLRGVVQGRGVDAPLNATGRAQAEAVARRLAAVPLDVIYTSTLRRAAETAEVVARAHAQAPLHRLADLEEMAWGVYEGAPPSAQIQRVFEHLNARWRRGEFAFRIEGGESILDVQRRARRAMAHILRHHPGRTVLVVTHGRFLRVLLAPVLDGCSLERMHEIQHANTAVNTLIWREGRFEAVELNCTAHLQGRAFSGAA